MKKASLDKIKREELLEMMLAQRESISQLEKKLAETEKRIEQYESYLANMTNLVDVTNQLIRVVNALQQTP